MPNGRHSRTPRASAANRTPARSPHRLAANRFDKIGAELEDAYDAENENKAEALESRREQVAGELQDAETALQDYAPDVHAVAGAIWPVPSSPSTAAARP